MQDQPNEAGLSPAAEDDQWQRIVLMQVLALHPSQLTMPELASEICEDQEDFAEGDALARAVRDLGAAGLLRMNGAHVVPTRVALHFDALLGG